jgi:rhamnose transport system ATP-binding protein
MQPESHIELHQISKRFRAVEALADVDLVVKRGTIHALVGENGAGKSTLGKIISGVIEPDRGTIQVDGRIVSYRSPRDALADGITTITQEIALLSKRSVIENVLLGIESAQYSWLNRREMRRRFDELMAVSGFDLPPDAIVGRLRLADQKKVEVLQAMARNTQLIIMDEPTAYLSDKETITFIEIVRRLQAMGKTIIYISHFLQETLDLADTVTVMRNARVIRTAPTADETPDTLVEAMLGKSMSQMFVAKRYPPADAPVVLSVRNLARKNILRDISLEIRAGEIVGIAGLVGSGRSRLARTLFGAERYDQGTIEIDGVAVELRSTGDAISAGIGMLPESRKEQGLSLKLPVGANITLPHLSQVSTAGLIRSRLEFIATTKMLNLLDIRPAHPHIRVNNLSGGNQQKVLFAKWLFRRPRVFIVDEPTRGIDVGAKQAVYELIVSLAADGMAVLLISSEIEEILGLAHRVLVMRRGSIVAEFADNGQALTEDAVIRAAFAAEDSAAQ